MELILKISLRIVEVDKYKIRPQGLIFIVDFFVIYCHLIYYWTMLMIEKNKEKNISEQRVKSHHIFQEDSTNAFFVKFPHIYHKIKKIWGSDVCREYLNNLVTDTRENSRAGFGHEQVSIIIKILDKHDLEFPQFIK